MILSISIPYDFGEILYLITDIDQLPRQLVAVRQSADNSTMVLLQQGTDFSWHYLMELSTEENTALKNSMS